MTKTFYVIRYNGEYFSGNWDDTWLVSYWFCDKPDLYNTAEECDSVKDTIVEKANYGVKYTQNLIQKGNLETVIVEVKFP